MTHRMSIFSDVLNEKNSLSFINFSRSYARLQKGIFCEVCASSLKQTLKFGLSVLRRHVNSSSGFKSTGGRIQPHYAALLISGAVIGSSGDWRRLQLTSCMKGWSRWRIGPNPLTPTSVYDECPSQRTCILS